MRKEAAYILRLWCDSERDQHWRASLENLRTRESKAFADLNKLTVFLEQEILQTNIEVQTKVEAQTPCKRSTSKV
jgi:hypothetical protein